MEANALFRGRSRSGVPVRMELSRTHRLRNTAVFKGVEGELVLEKNGFETCGWRRGGEAALAPLAAKDPFVGRDWPAALESCFARQMEEFLSAARGGKGLVADARRAASTSSLIEWAYKRRETRGMGTSARSGAAGRFSGDAAVVTGGTGFIGQKLVERLFEEGAARVTVPVRNYRTCAEAARFPIEMPRVDLLCPDSVRAAVKGSRWVFHCAYGVGGAKPADVTVKGTRHVVEAAIDAGCEAVVVFSTIAVFGFPEGAVVDESWPYRPALGEYGRSKARMERWCLEKAARSSRTRIAVLNPTCVYGPGGKAYTAMPREMVLGGSFCWIDGGCGNANYAHVANVVEAAFLAVLCPAAHGQRFIINDGVTAWRDFLGPMLGAEGLGIESFTRAELSGFQRDRAVRLLRKIPGIQAAKRWAQRLTPRVVKKLQASSQSAKQVPPEWLADLFGPVSTRFSSEKAKKILGWEPRVGLEEGQRLAVEWLKQARLI